MEECFFCKKSGNVAFFCKKKCKMFFLCEKVENGGGCFFVKKWTFPQHGVHFVQYQYFFILHFTYLGVRQRTPCLRACGLRAVNKA